MAKYIVLHGDGYNTHHSMYENKSAMLEGVQGYDIEKIEVYELARKVKLRQQPRIIEDVPEVG